MQNRPLTSIVPFQKGSDATHLRDCDTAQTRARRQTHRLRKADTEHRPP